MLVSNDDFVRALAEIDEVCSAETAGLVHAIFDAYHGSGILLGGALVELPDEPGELMPEGWYAGR